jgi:hypothetical protein
MLVQQQLQKFLPKWCSVAVTEEMQRYAWNEGFRSQLNTIQNLFLTNKGMKGTIAIIKSGP